MEGEGAPYPSQDLDEVRLGRHVEDVLHSLRKSGLPSAVEVGVVLKTFVSACLIEWTHFTYGVLVLKHN